MSRLSLIPPAVCAAFMAAAALAHAQTPQSTQNPANAPAITAPTQEQQAAINKLPDKIRDKLTDEGFTEVTVVPGSFIVSGRDKDGKAVMMLIGPNSMSVMTSAEQPDSDQSIAESPAEKTPNEKKDNGSDHLIQQ
jgi:hypothetical protein